MVPAHLHTSPPLCAGRATALACTLVCSLALHTALAQTAAPQVVEVVGPSPLPGQGVDRALLPYATQVLRRATLDEAGAATLTDLMMRRLASVQVNDIQGSPFQSDLMFRGFRASGLLGAAQGLSVYLDGVRINEAFGDVVNWDLVPEFALDSVTLVPGANPAYGLNTLGGAIALTTVDGRSAPGTRADLSLGSFGRRRLDLGHGLGGADGWHGYAGGSFFDEDGWRDESPGELGLGLLKLGRRSATGQWTLGLLLARSRLTGNGLVPQLTLVESEQAAVERVPDLYPARRSAVYTHPDRTRNTLRQLAFNGRHGLDDDSELGSLAYVRASGRRTVNGDGAEDEDAAWPAALNTTASRQRAWGLALSLSQRLGPHQLQWGAALDGSRTHYRQDEQAGDFTAGRGVVAGDEAPELSAQVQGQSLALGLYATDTWRLSPSTAVTGTARWNRVRVSNQLTTVDDDSGELEFQPRERFTYSGLNPALGLTQQLGGGLALFGNLSRNTRVPTVIELGCANPEEPCRLPAGLQSDPYLAPVRSSSVELGARWRSAGGQQASLSLYRTDNRDDILFTSVSSASQLGYFSNFPRTRHQGLDAEWQGRVGSLLVFASYSRLRASYQAQGLLRFGARNVEVRPGMAMAGLPRDTLKLGADWPAAPGWTLGLDTRWQSRRGVLGNEDGLIEDGADEPVDLGLGGYAVINLRASWQARPGLELSLRIDNALDRRHESFGALAETVFGADGAYSGDERDALFVAPGAPRAVFLALRLRF